MVRPHVIALLVSVIAGCGRSPHGGSSSDGAPAQVSAALVTTRPPTGLKVTRPSGGAYTNDAEVTLALTASGVGAASVAEYCIADTPVCPSENWVSLLPVPKLIAYTASFTLTGTDGAKTVRVWFRDDYGNTTPTPASLRLVLDTQAPSDGVVKVAPVRSGVKLSVAGATDTGSGIARFLVAAGPSGGAPGDCTGAVLVCTAGLSCQGLVNNQTYDLRVCAIDRAGNMSAGVVVADVTPRMNVLPPVMTGVGLKPPSSTVTNQATATLLVGARAFGGSVVTDLCAVEVPATVTDCEGAWQPVATPAVLLSKAELPVTFSSGDGAKVFRVWARDDSMNVARLHGSITFTVDTVPPLDGTARVLPDPGPAAPVRAQVCLRSADCRPGFICFRADPSAPAGVCAAACDPGEASPCESEGFAYDCVSPTVGPGADPSACGATKGCPTGQDCADDGYCSAACESSDDCPSGATCDPNGLCRFSGCVAPSTCSARKADTGGSFSVFVSGASDVGAGLSSYRIGVNEDGTAAADCSTPLSGCVTRGQRIACPALPTGAVVSGALVCASDRAGNLSSGVLVEAQPPIGACVSKTLATAEFDFSYIPSGVFTMGAPRTDPEASTTEKPQHLVSLTQPFLLARTETTVAQWQAVNGLTPTGTELERTRPKDRLSWDDAVAFCDKLSELEGVEPATYGLPTEAQWEFAARAGVASPRWSRIDEIAWYNMNAGADSHATATRLPNPWNLSDMLGNVWEWTADWHGNYTANGQTNPTGPVAGTGHVVRGGAWNAPAIVARVTGYRYNGAAIRGYHAVGFRVRRTSP